jgi:hypothetical protein
MRALAFVVAAVLVLPALVLACADVLGFQDLTGSALCEDAAADAASGGDAGGSCGQPGGG